MDSITKADGMEGVQTIRMASGWRVALDEDTMGLLAEALDMAAHRMRYRANQMDGHPAGIHGAHVVDTLRAKAARLDVLMAVVDAADTCALDMPGWDFDKGVPNADSQAAADALVDAGAQA